MSDTALQGLLRRYLLIHLAITVYHEPRIPLVLFLLLTAPNLCRHAG